MNNAFPPDMARSLLRHAPNAVKLNRRGFSLVEVLIAVSIAAGVVSVLASATKRQTTLGEQTNRLTAVEAVVSADLDWFSNYARLWKLKTGSYSLNTDITMTTSPYTVGGAASYEPSAADCNSGLAEALLADGRRMYLYSATKKVSLKTYIPPYEIKISDNTRIPVTVGGIGDLTVVRKVDPVGNKIRVFYSLDGPNADGLNFSREASLLVEATAWCDRLS
jgi:prepilin-type N-terminal cleavage/methylation domain-containing protein